MWQKKANRQDLKTVFGLAAEISGICRTVEMKLQGQSGLYCFDERMRVTFIFKELCKKETRALDC